MAADRVDIDLSVVAPAHNEEPNAVPLVTELNAVLDMIPLRSEIVIVDDGSSDATLDVLCRLSRDVDRLRVVALPRTPSGLGHGQSAAILAGIRASRGDLIAGMDADLQNDPSDIPVLLEALQRTGADLVQGDRCAARRDGFIRRVSSLVGRLVRRALLRDTIRDTGCSLRIMRRTLALQLPLQYRGMHRFIPLTARQLGYRVVEIPVGHRPRVAGQTSYGIWNRAIPGLIDCFGVRWLHRRRRPIEFDEVTEPRTVDTPANAEPVETTP
ncbi:MAG: glycosyltransferase family 2 protein [Planctomycetota bacterium]